MREIKFLDSFLLLIAGIMILFTWASAHAQPSGALESEIEARQEELTIHQRAIDRLSQQEREVYSMLAKAEDRLDEISKTLQAREKKLADILSRELAITSQYENLALEKAKTQKKLTGLLENIWPIFLESQGKGLSEMMEWSDLEREMTWLRAIYHEAEKTYALLQDQSENLVSTLKELQAMKNEFQEGLRQVNKTKDQLLNEKLNFLKQLQDIRAQRLAGEEMISEIIEVIDSLSYQMSAVTTEKREFEELKGRLIWPAAGSLVSSFSPSGDPPHNGLSISLNDNSPVQAISWGKVMHNDTLRGFGRVVILFHGNNYYTLYAYLSESNLQIGQEVEKGEPIGNAGYYPQIKNHGIYFELRFKQKAINPIPWLEKL
jgi:murein hydrolase activator